MEREIKMRKKEKHYLSIIIILLLCIGIGYAYLSSTLNSSFSNISVTGFDRICQRATTLHSEKCTSSSTSGYCKAGGSSITYGQIGSNGTLKAGDAFDCDVNNDGVYDAATERFYYVTDLKTSVAILIYYNNSYQDGACKNCSLPYHGGGDNYHGPATAYNYLPTSSQWPKVSLYTTSKQIYNESGGTTVSNGRVTKTLPKYTYTRPTRLLTEQEFKKISSNIFWENFGGHNGTTAPSCIWLNTPYTTSASYNLVESIQNPTGTTIAVMPKGVTDSCAIRPVIEVLKSKMIY